MIQQTLEDLLLNDPLAVQALNAVRSVGPLGAYVAAGFVRNRFWDSLYPAGPAFPDNDIDVIYFSGTDTSLTTEESYEHQLLSLMPEQCWQVRNQARMHLRAGHNPFKSITHALEHWPETATAVAVRLNGEGRLEFLAPFGLDDLADHVLRITPVVARHDPGVFAQRLRVKGWRQRWARLRVIAD